MIKTREGHRGQGLVEFALVIPIFLLLLFGLIDVGRLVYMNSVLSQAAREGARTASVEASWLGSSDPSCNTPGGPICPADIATLQAHVTASVNKMVAPFGSIPSNKVYVSCVATSPPTGAWTTANPSPCVNHSSGNLVSVRVLLTFSPITPVASGIVGSPTLAGAATMAIN